jgi:hypothetical protein
VQLPKVPFQLLPGCRRVAAEVLEQLHASEILQEQARYKRWQAACEAWRTLRSRHAVACFCMHVSQELAEPAERLQLFEQLRQGQQEAHTQLLKLCGRLHQLSPPHLSSQLVASWVADATQWLEGWQQQLGRFQQGLQQQEKQLEDKVCVHGLCGMRGMHVLAQALPFQQPALSGSCAPVLHPLSQVYVCCACFDGASCCLHLS